MNLNVGIGYSENGIYFEASFDGDCKKFLAKIGDIDSNSDSGKEALLASLKLTKLISDDSLIDSTQSFISNSTYTGYIGYLGDAVKVISNEETNILKAMARGAKVTGKTLGLMAKGIEGFINETGVDQPYLKPIASGIAQAGSVLSVTNFLLKTVTAAQEISKKGISLTEGVNVIASASKVYLIGAPLVMASPPLLGAVSVASSVATIVSAGIKVQSHLSKPRVLTEEEELEKEFSNDNPSNEPLFDVV